MSDVCRVTRLAPSPTGALHLGNARTFLINWALARQQGWRVLLRIEDLDTPRVKPGAAEQAIEDLTWLGLDWDDGPSYQLADLSPYEDAIATLHEAGLTYACHCTRKEIEAAQSAPHGDEHELRYPGTCRERAEGRDGETSQASGAGIADDPRDAAATRVRIPDEAIKVDDAVAGRFTCNVQRSVGDFVVWTKAALPAYQLAVVIDDARQGVTDIVRGDDLLPSAARQQWLYRLLHLAPPPRYWHLPLVLGEDGRRLAKRHGDTRLASYREAGVPAEHVIGLLASYCGIGPSIDDPGGAGVQPMSAKELTSRFDLRGLPREAVTFRDAHHDWLMGHRRAAR